jgi:hypothetical protein
MMLLSEAASYYLSPPYWNQATDRLIELARDNEWKPQKTRDRRHPETYPIENRGLPSTTCALICGVSPFFQDGE